MISITVTVKDPLEDRVELSTLKWIGLMRLGFLIAIALALQIVALLATAPYSGSLWIDEIISAWITDGTIGEVVSRALSYQGQSPLYFLLIWLARHIALPLEAGVRIASLLALVLAGWGLWRIVDNGRDSLASIWAVVLFLTLDSVIVASVSARPYMLALALVIWSFHFFQTWLRTGSSLHEWLFIGCTVAAFYMHYLYIGILLVELLWWYAYKPRRTIVGDKRAYIEMVGSLGCITALCIPGLYQLIQLLYRSQELAFAAPPDGMSLLPILLPPLCLIALALAFVMTFVEQGAGNRQWVQILRRPFVVCLLFFHVFPPVFFFLWSISGGPGLFLHRYFLWHLVGLVLALGILIAELVPHRRQLLMLGCVVGLSLFSSFARPWRIEDWRGALNEISQQQQHSLVLLYTGLIEAERGGFIRSLDNRDYLLAPVRVYGPSLEALPLPFTIDSVQQSEYRNGELIPALEERTRLTLVAVEKEILVHDDGFKGSVPHLVAFLGTLGFETDTVQQFGTVQAVTMRRTEPHSPNHGVEG